MAEDEDSVQSRSSLPYIASPGVDNTWVDNTAAQSSIYHPLFDESLNYSATVVPDDPDAQVSATINLMRQYVREDAANSPEIRREAQEIYRQCLGDRAIAVRSIWWKVQQKIQFLRDESTAQPLESFLNKAYGSTPIVEILIRPRDMADLKHRRVGDCDDYSMYCAALLMALGIDCSFVTIAGNAKDPNHFTHVYVAAYPHGFSGERIAVDASHGKYCGWEGKRPGMRCVEWKVSDGVGEPVDSIVSGVLGTVLFVGAAAGFVYWMLR